MPHVWPFTALSAVWRKPCARTDSRAIVPAIEAFVDRAPIDWRALRASVHGGHDRALVDALQAIDALRAPGRPVTRPRESPARHRLAWLLIALAATEILVSAAFVVPAVIADARGRAVVHLLLALAFAASPALLSLARARDARQVYFFGFLLCGGTSFARAALAAIPEAPPWTRLLWLEGLAPACLWQFALDFPRVDRFARFDRVARRVAALVWGFGIAAAAAGVAATAGFVPAAAVQPLLPNHAGSLFWRGYSLATVLAVAAIVIRAHRAPRDEQRTVTRLAASLAVGTGPFLIVGIARTAIPGFEDWFLGAPPAVRLALDALVMMTLLATPILLATAVVLDRPFDRQTRLAQAGRRLVRRLAVLSDARHRRELTRALRALGGARGMREASGIVADAIAGGLQASLVRVLTRRGDDFVDCLGSSLTVPRGAAFVTMLHASAQPLNVSAAGAIHSRLPAREREWLATESIHMAAPIVTRDGALAAIVVAGDRDRLVNLERRDLWFAEAVAAAASASWGDASVTPRHERSPIVDEPALECRQCGAVQPSAPMRCRCGAAPVVAALPAHLAGSFAVRRRLGSGGMGVVYLGRDLRLDRDVALKTLPAIAPNAIERLRREARAMASLNHDALATIYGLEVWRDVPVLVCEYFPNGTLADRLARAGPLPAAETVRLGARLARGLEYMHASGVLHGDITPANIGFTARNDATLLDFGLSRLAAGLVDGMPYAVGGTLAYLPPEALRGESPSPSLDLWALAIVVVECLVGRNPVARDVEVLTRAAIAAADPIAITTPIRGVNPPLAAMLTRALGPAGARFPSAAAIAEAFEGLAFRADPTQRE